MTRAWALATTLLLCALLAAGCAGLGEEGKGIALQPVAKREKAPAFSSPALDGGGRVTLAAHAGRPVVLNFWASWCEPCKKEMPALVQFAKDHPEIDVVGLAVNDVPSDSRRFARKVGADFELGVDRDADVALRYDATGLPVTAIIDSKGRVAATVFGGVTRGALDGVADDLT